MRRYLPPAVWALAAGAGLLTFGLARAQVERPPNDAGERGAARDRLPRDRDARDRGDRLEVFEGESARGDLQAALDDAVRQALRAQPGADRMVSYRVREITGEQGGIAARNILRVAIEVAAEDAGRAPREPREPLPPNGEPPPANDPDDLTELLRRSLRANLSLSDERVDRAGPVTLSLAVENTSDDPVRVPFPTGQKYDFEVWRGNRLVWRWSQGRFFTQALSSTVVRPREEVTYSVSWNLRNSEGVRVPPGQYTVRGYLTTRGTGDFRVMDTATLTVTDQVPPEE